MKVNRQKKSAVVLAVILVFTLLLGILGITTFFHKKSKYTGTKANLTSNSSEKNIKESSINEKIKVSVIVPVYKTEKYLKECIDSIRNQTLKDIEIICIDDGSPDKCGEMLESFAKEDKRIKVFHQKNAGVSTARNKGIELATGEYLKFVDSDDTIADKTCEISYNKAKAQDADVLIHDMGKNKILKKPVFDILTLTCWRCLYRREFINRENVRFKIDLKYAEDQTFNLTCFPKANKIVLTDDALYNYCQSNPNSVCRLSNVEVHSTSHAKAVRYVYENWKENGYFRDDNVKVKFLHWALSNKNWDTQKISKMFVDAIGPELLKDNVLNLLNKDDRKEYKKMIEDARQLQKVQERNAA